MGAGQTILTGRRLRFVLLFPVLAVACGYAVSLSVNAWPQADLRTWLVVLTTAPLALYCFVRIADPPRLIVESRGFRVEGLTKTPLIDWADVLEFRVDPGKRGGMAVRYVLLPEAAQRLGLRQVLAPDLFTTDIHATPAGAYLGDLPGELGISPDELAIMMNQRKKAADVAAGRRRTR